MSANPPQQTLRVQMSAILDNVHAIYAKQVAALIQENAELQGGQDVALARIAELEVQLSAMSPRAGEQRNRGSWSPGSPGNIPVFDPREPEEDEDETEKLSER